MNDKTIFIIDESIINCFFSEDNEVFCRADLFFTYLSLRSHHRYAFMVPGLYKKIYDKLLSKDKETALYFENWVENSAEIIGESEDQNLEKEDTIALLDILESITDSTVILVSDKFKDNPEFKGFTVLDVNELDRFLKNKKDFSDLVYQRYYSGSY